MKIAITGSNGYVGKHLLDFFLEEGYYVLGMQRNYLSVQNNLSFSYYNLSDKVNFNDHKDIDVLIHCAFVEFSQKNKDADAVNTKAARNLISECSKTRTKIIYLSTFSAHESATSHYGANKFKLETLFKEAGHIVLRLGIVVSVDGGMFPQMLKTIRSSKVLPLISGGHQPMQFIDIKRLCEVIKKTIHYKGTVKEFNIGSCDYISMEKFYNKITSQLNLKRYRIYIPIWVMFFVIKFSKIIGISLPFNNENLLGLKAMKYIETMDSLLQLEIPIFYSKDVLRLYFSKAEG
jgi:nucleoside-diphosphate-sugar epimerase